MEINNEKCTSLFTENSTSLFTEKHTFVFTENSTLLFTDYRNVLKDKITEYESQLEHQTNTFAGKEFAQLRKRILEADTTHKEMEKYSRIAVRWEDLKPLRVEFDKTENQYDILKAEIAKFEQTEDDNLIINTIKRSKQHLICTTP